MILEDVAPGSSAEAGLKVGEIVTSVGGKRVDDLRQFALDRTPTGQSVDVGVSRKGAANIPVTVMERTTIPNALPTW